MIYLIIDSHNEWQDNYCTHILNKALIVDIVIFSIYIPAHVLNKWVQIYGKLKICTLKENICFWFFVKKFNQHLNLKAMNFE